MKATLRKMKPKHKCLPGETIPTTWSGVGPRAVKEPHQHEPTQGDARRQHHKMATSGSSK